MLLTKLRHTGYHSPHFAGCSDEAEVRDEKKIDVSDQSNPQWDSKVPEKRLVFGHLHVGHQCSNACLTVTLSCRADVISVDWPSLSHK